MAIRPKLYQQVVVAGAPAPAIGYVSDIEKYSKMVIYVVRLDSGDTVRVTGADLQHQK